MIPGDPALPALPRLLDAPGMALELGGPCRIKGVRYKPGRRLAVRYAIESAENGTLAAAVADARRDLRRHPGFRARIGALVIRFPADPALPALADPTAIARRLGVPPGTELMPLAYKPLTRAVVRMGDHVVKAYSDDGHYCRALVAQRRLTGLARPATAPFEAAWDDLRATAHAVVPGVQAHPALQARAAGALLHELHAVDHPDLTERSFSRLLDDAATAASLIAAVLPHRARDARRVIETLESHLPPPAPPVTAHGDFCARNLVVDGATLTIVDIDNLALAPAAIDLAAYAAHADAGDYGAALAILEELLAGYGAAPTGLAWCLAASMLFRVRTPFQSYLDQWPDLVEAWLDAAAVAARSLL